MDYPHIGGTFNVFFDIHLNKRLRKQWSWWWFRAPCCSCDLTEMLSINKNVKASYYCPWWRFTSKFTAQKTAMQKRMYVLLCYQQNLWEWKFVIPSRFQISVRSRKYFSHAYVNGVVCNYNARSITKKPGLIAKCTVRQKRPGSTQRCLVRQKNALPSMHQLTLPLSNTLPAPYWNYFLTLFKRFVLKIPYIN